MYEIYQSSLRSLIARHSRSHSISGARSSRFQGEQAHKLLHEHAHERSCDYFARQQHTRSWYVSRFWLWVVMMTVLCRCVGKTLFIPRISVETPGHMDFLQLHGREDLGSLKAGTWGIKEPDLHWLGNPRQ